ncbi:MAG: hypothetical protein RPU64_15755 [Candidatus Sedimenticola sp. (ex Thyasira tokunagai)]
MLNALPRVQTSTVFPASRLSKSLSTLPSTYQKPLKKAGGSAGYLFLHIEVNQSKKIYLLALLIAPNWHKYNSLLKQQRTTFTRNKHVNLSCLLLLIEIKKHWQNLIYSFIKQTDE